VYKMTLSSKRGDISVMILVMLTLALCIFALVSFSIANNGLGEQIKDYNVLEKNFIEFDNNKFLGINLPFIEEKKLGKDDVLEYWAVYTP